MSAKKTRPTKTSESSKGVTKYEKPEPVTLRKVLNAPVPDACPQGGPHEWVDDECSKCREPRSQSAAVAAKAKGKRARAQSKTPDKTKPVKAKAALKTKKLSALDAAVKVLAEAQAPMTTREMIEAMADKGYWSSPNGQTPAATLYSAILRQINTKGQDCRFVKTERGRFGLNK